MTADCQVILLRREFINFFAEGIGGHVYGMMSKGVVVLVWCVLQERCLSDN